MREAFLHFVWRTRRFSATDLCTTNGEKLEILDPGEWNTNAGPDFFNARIRIGKTLWAGNIELHVKASDWNLHEHSNDPAYNNVVLHVVYEDDTAIQGPNGQPLPCLVLKNRIPPRLINTWFRLQHERKWIPCAAEWPETLSVIRRSWLERLMVERLEAKTQIIASVLKDTGHHWEEAFYRLLARHFGLKVNVEPFEWLARLVPLSLIGKHRHHLPQVEALLFGQAGMLEEPFADDYPQALAREYRFLRHKYKLGPMDRSVWKFFRIRPAGFPTVRIAQLSALLHQRINLFSTVVDARNVDEIVQLFNMLPSEYWNSHYRFDRPSVFLEKRIGTDMIHNLLINTALPMLYHYGKRHGRSDICERALDWLCQLPPETNRILDGWRDLGEHIDNAGTSQALLQLKKHYCDARRCLECQIGASLLR